MIRNFVINEKDSTFSDELDKIDFLKDMSIFTGQLRSDY